MTDSPIKNDEKASNRMKLWKHTECMEIDYELKPEDERMICEQFFKKINALKSNSPYIPDCTKDSVFSGQYQSEPLDLYEFCNRDECISSVKCTQMRTQSLFLLEYARNETFLIEALVDKFHTEEDSDSKMCLKELIKKKKGNLILIEKIRGGITEMICCAQDAADHFDSLYKIAKKS